MSVLVNMGASLLGGLLDSHPKDAQRLDANARAYADAMNGDPEALAYLKGRSGRFGLVTSAWSGSGGVPEQLGGWATGKAMDDAYAKYQAVLGQGKIGQAVAAGGEWLQDVGNKVTELGTIAKYGGGYVQPQGASVSPFGMSWSTLILVGLVAVVAFKLLRKG